MGALKMEVHATSPHREHERLRTQLKRLSIFAEAACTRELGETYRRLEEVRTVIAELVRLAEGRKTDEEYYRSVLWYAKAFLLFTEPGNKPMRWEDVQVAREMLLQACRALHVCIVRKEGV